MEFGTVSSVTKDKRLPVKRIETENDNESVELARAPKVALVSILLSVSMCLTGGM